MNLETHSIVWRNKWTRNYETWISYRERENMCTHSCTLLDSSLMLDPFFPQNLDRGPPLFPRFCHSQLPVGKLLQKSLHAYARSWYIQIRVVDLKSRVHHSQKIPNRLKNYGIHKIRKVRIFLCTQWNIYRNRSQFLKEFIKSTIAQRY